MTEAIPPSSPLSSAPSSASQLPTLSSLQKSQWRSTRELPFEIQQYVRIYFEEALFSRALDLLLSIVSADASSQHNDIIIPLPEHLALAATIVVHPLETTRTSSEERWIEANAALRLLRIVLRVVGPINSKLKEAFRFKKLYNNSNSEELENAIKHPLASEESIWNRADDFWAVLGWSLNCSCLSGMYALRWEHWQLWLEFMIDVLEIDWKCHLSSNTPNQSLLWKYVGHFPGDTSQPRRIVRAIFADGSKTALNEFREVFRRELKGPKQAGNKTEKREAVDIDKEIYGDYLQQDDSDDSSDTDTRPAKRTSTRTLSTRRITPRTSHQSLRSDPDDDATATTTTQTLGPPKSLTLRLRLMQLLVNIATQPTLTQSRTTNFPDLPDLFTLLIEFIKPLPLPIFQQLTTPAVAPSTLSVSTHTTLLEFLLQRLLETPSTTLDPTQPLTQDRLVTAYLPYAANKSTLDANARVCLCVEALLRDLANTGMLSRTGELVAAVETGIERRLEKVSERKERVKAGNREEEEAWAWLSESATRMRAVLRRLKG